MEIHRFCCYIFINILFFSSTSCKPVSLNDIIAAEKQSATLQKPQLKVSDSKAADTRELPRKYKILTLSKHMTSGSLANTDKKLSPLNTFQIRAPLRPKKIKYSFPRSRRLNSAIKRETDNDTFNRNYIPLLKSLSLLFNNILREDSRDDDTEYYNNQESVSRSEECVCARKSNYETRDRKSTKKATPFTSPISSTIITETQTTGLTKTATTPTYNSFDDNIGPLRRNKNVPVLPARDSVSSRRNHNGFSQGSLSTYNRNFEGHITGNNRSDENNNSGRKTTESYTENYKEYTDSRSGDDASYGSFGRIGGNGFNTSNTTDETPSIEATVESEEALRHDRGNSDQFKGFHNFETRRNKTESRILLSQSSSRLRRFQSQEETTEILWQIESPKESNFDITYNYTSNRRLSNRNGSVAAEDQEIRGADSKLRIQDLPMNIITSKPNYTQNKDKQKIVVIYDGYSIARDVNGENKLSEKGYRVLS